MNLSISDRRLAAAAILVLLSACGQRQAMPTPATHEPPAIEGATKAAAMPLSTAASPDSQIQDLPTPTARAGLQATDPTKVDLASGQPTLVEFFAFW
jgi:hypothetical protein